MKVLVNPSIPNSEIKVTGDHHAETRMSEMENLVFTGICISPRFRASA
jgi:hypothetical protein